MKNLILILCLATITPSFAQDKSACANCNERYLKTRTFGGTNSIIVNRTMYVFYKLYTPNKNTCLSQNSASENVVNAFEQSLSSNELYIQLLEQYDEKFGYKPSHANKLVGRIVHFTEDHNEILDPFKNGAENLKCEIKYIELDANLEQLFAEYVLCD